MSNWIALSGALASLLVALTGLIAVLKGQKQTHVKLDEVKAEVVTPNGGGTIGEQVEAIAQQVAPSDNLQMENQQSGD